MSRKSHFFQAMMLAVLIFALNATATELPGEKRPRRGAMGPFSLPLDQKIVGEIRSHTVQKGETLLDIARRYDLGFKELQDLYPQLDPWLPPNGTVIRIPTRWILPSGLQDKLIVNIVELRLYYFDRVSRCIVTFPVSVGEASWPTPQGLYTVTTKEVRPAWSVPPSLAHKYDFKTLPPGPNNPLGDFWMGLGNTAYGIHGTDFPWSIGRAVTRGCIRMYPEDIDCLFGLVRPGTRVSIVYEPIKFCVEEGRVFVEVHQDLYNHMENFCRYGLLLLEKKPFAKDVDLIEYRRALDRRDGVPVDVTSSLFQTQR